MVIVDCENYCGIPDGVHRQIEGRRVIWRSDADGESGEREHRRQSASLMPRAARLTWSFVEWYLIETYWEHIPTGIPWMLINIHRSTVDGYDLHKAWLGTFRHPT